MSRLCRSQDPAPLLQHEDQDLSEGLRAATVDVAPCRGRGPRQGRTWRRADTVPDACREDPCCPACALAAPAPTCFLDARLCGGSQREVLCTIQNCDSGRVRRSKRPRCSSSGPGSTDIGATGDGLLDISAHAPAHWRRWTTPQERRGRWGCALSVESGSLEALTSTPPHPGRRRRGRPRRRTRWGPGVTRRLVRPRDRMVAPSRVVIVAVTRHLPRTSGPDHR